LKAAPYNALRDQILFVNIGKEAESFFDWKNPNAKLTFNQLDVANARRYEGDLSYYIHLKKQDYKLVFRNMSPPLSGETNLIFIVGATPECQYQAMEAFLEYLAKQWFDIYDTTYMQASSFGEIFNGFEIVVDDAFIDVPKDYLMLVQSHCKACGKNYEIYVRKSLIENAESFPAALVFEHADHALLLYIDEQYNTRGESSVDISG
jgi:hypothetical protein